MTALLAAFGWKALAVIGAGIVALVAWFASLAKAKSSGVAQQQAADSKQREVDLAKASTATGSVSELDDAAVLRELHAQYDRQPVRLGEGDNRQP